MSHGKTKFIIFKISDDKKEIVLDDVSPEQDYEAFRNKLCDARDDKGNPAPRYAVYDVEYELSGGAGKRYVCYSFTVGSKLTLSRSKIIFISWVPTDTPTFVCSSYYAR